MIVNRPHGFDITEETFTTPASILCLAVGALLLMVAFSRSIPKWRNSKQRFEVISPHQLTATSRTLTSNISTDSQTSDMIEDSEHEPPSSTMMHRDDQRTDIYSNEERVLVYREKTTTWKKVFGKRVMKSSHSHGEVVVCILYLVINVAALLASPMELDVGFGMLSAGNTVFVFLTAARNSILSWLVGVSFEQMLVYHRFVGAVTVLLGFVHTCFYINRIIDDTSDPVIWTGLVTMGCGVVIVVSSLNVIRRKFFNVFYWSHFSFIGFIVGMYLHAAAARPYLVASIACYVADKGLQMLWKLPHQTTVFTKVDDRTVHVQFGKAPFSSLLKEYKVGQYFFVNFPSISLQEWHVSFLQFRTIKCALTYHILTFFLLVPAILCSLRAP